MTEIKFILSCLLDCVIAMYVTLFVNMDKEIENYKQ